MSRSLFFYALLILSISSCKPVLKLIYGVKKPKPKTDLQVIEYANKIFDRDYKIYRPVDSIAYSKVLDLGLNTIPGIAFFDSNGDQKSIHQDTVRTCTASADNFIKHLDLLDDAPKMTLKKVDILPHIVRIDANETRDSNQKFKNSIIIIWADWIGPKLNKEQTADWLKVYHELDQEAQDDIDLIILNMDVLEDMES